MKPKELKTPSAAAVGRKNARATPLHRKKKKNPSAPTQIPATFQAVHLWSVSAQPTKEPPSKLIFEFFKNSKIPKEDNINLVLKLIENENDAKTAFRKGNGRELLVNCNEDPYLASNNPESMPTMKKPNFTVNKPDKILIETNKNYTKMLNDLVVRL